MPVVLRMWFLGQEHRHYPGASDKCAFSGSTADSHVMMAGPCHLYLPNFPSDSDATAAAAKSLQLCPTLCDPRDGSPPGSPVPGILQARTLEWVAISFSNA